MNPFSNNHDQALREALEAVEVPARLRGQIVARLHLAAREDQALGLPAVVQDLASSPEATTPESDRFSTSPRTSRRYWLAAGLAALAASLSWGIVQWNRPSNPDQLSQFCLLQLDRLMNEPDQWQTGFDAQLSQLSALDGQLRSDFRPIGFQDRSGSPFGPSHRVWKLHSASTNKAFYVLMFADARTVSKLGSKLSLIDSVSGGWSLAAMQQADQLVVVLFEGPPQQYLVVAQAA